MGQRELSPPVLVRSPVLQMKIQGAYQIRISGRQQVYVFVSVYPAQYLAPTDHKNLRLDLKSLLTRFLRFLAPGFGCSPLSGGQLALLSSSLVDYVFGPLGHCLNIWL